jgi:hypothetical protein
VEWWDAYYLTNDAYPSVDAPPAAVRPPAGTGLPEAAVSEPSDPYRRELITHLVQHPIPTRPPRPEATPTPREMPLTRDVRAHFLALGAQTAPQATHPPSLALSACVHNARPSLSLSL